MAFPAEVHFYWDRRRTRRGAALLIAIAAAGSSLMLIDDVDAKVLGLAWGIAFAALAGVVYSRGSKRQPIVTISTRGILDRRISAEPIQWDSVARIVAFEAENVPFVGIDFHDAKAALGTAKPLVRMIAPMHRLLGFPAVSINTSLLDASDEDLIRAVETIRPALVQRH
jgi:hypothetical protein